MKLGEASENAARIMRFKQLERQGAGKLEGAYQSRDLLDFAMKGGAAPVQALIGMIPFLNARAQGNYRMYRGMKENPVDFFIKGALLAAASLAIWGMFKDDDRYKELEDYEKHAYYNIWIGDQQIRIPKPFETGVIFSSFVESIANVASGNEEMDFLVDFALYSARETFAFNPLPQAIKPLYEVYANKSFFTGRPIEGASLQSLKPGERGEYYTSETLRAIGRKTNLSPKKMESIVRGYTASLGSFLLFMPDQMARWFGGFPEKPTLRSNDYPLLGRFWRQGEARNTKYMSRFYELMEESNQTVATIKHYRALGDYDEARKLAEDKRVLRVMNSQLKKVQRRLSDIRKRMKRVYDSNQSPEAKAEQLDRLMERRNALSKRAYELYRSRI
jgi:hypothetical protein